MTEPPTPKDFQVPSKRVLLEATGVAAVVALIALTLFILPAEYGIDPTGFGQAIGIRDLGVPSDAVASVHTPEDAPYSNHTVDIIVPARTGLEYKFELDAGGALVYAWNATGPVFFDFHGEPAGDTTGFFESYDEDTASVRAGAFAAPFAGSHGWYFRNDSATDVTVHLVVSGYFDVIGIKT